MAKPKFSEGFYWAQYSDSEPTIVQVFYWRTKPYWTVEFIGCESSFDLKEMIAKGYTLKPVAPLEQ
jgi:hypothetical protein